MSYFGKLTGEDLSRHLGRKA